MKEKHSFAAEQKEEALAGVVDGLEAGGTLKDVTRDAATYGVKPEVVANLRTEPEPGREMTPQQWAERVAHFVSLSVECGYRQPDADGQQRVWNQMSPEGQLGNIAIDSAHHDVSFEGFSAAAKKMIDPKDLLGASLRVAFESKRELRDIDMVLPDDGRTEPTPLVDQVKNVVADLAHAEGYIRKQQEQEGLER